jgi:hypothetical protein
MSDEPRRRRGPAWWATVVLVGAVVLVVLFTVVFPWLERNLSNPTLGASSGVAGLEPVGELFEGVTPRA